MPEIKVTGMKSLISAIQFDATEDEPVENAARHFEQNRGKLDAPVNNAGVAYSDL